MRLVITNTEAYDWVQRQRQIKTWVQELMAIAERCAKHIRQPVSAVEHGDMLYDESGMPQ